MSIEIPYSFPYAYASEIGSRIRQWQVWDVDYGLSQDPRFYATLESDGIINFLLRFRSQLVAGANWGCDPVTESDEDKRAANVMETLLSHIGYFSQARQLLSMAFLTGSTWSRIGGELRDVCLPVPGRKEKMQGNKRPAPDRVLRYLERRIAVDPQDQEAKLILKHLGRPAFAEKKTCRARAFCVTQLFDVNKRRFDLRRLEGHIESNLKGTRWGWHFAGQEFGVPVTWDPINPKHWVHHTYHADEASLSWGRGLSRPLYFLALFKTEAMQRGMSWLEKWAEGWLTAEIDQLQIGALDETSLARLESWLTLLKKMKSQHTAVHGVGDKINVLEGSKIGWDAAMGALDYFDNACSRLILGAVLPTGGASDKGSLARAAVESDSTAALIAHDREQLAETITESVVKLLWDINRPLFLGLGLKDANCPRFVIRHAEAYEAEERAQTAKTLIDAGLGKWMKPREILSACGFGVAEEGEETLGEKPGEEKPGNGNPAAAAAAAMNGKPQNGVQDPRKQRSSQELIRKMRRNGVRG